MEDIKGKEIDLLYKPENFRVSDSGPTEWSPLDDEQYRVYVFPDMEIQINHPLKLNVSKSGGHRVWDARGISHYIPSGWRHLYWVVKKDKNHFEF